MATYALQLSEAEIARYRSMAERARADEADLWKAAGIRPGARVADVGCGPGAVLSLLAEIVGPAGEVVGVDADPDAVAAAESLLAETGASNASVRVGQADETALPLDSFDVVTMRHVLAHNGGAEQQIVDHLATLVRPGGAVYLVDVVARGMAVYPQPPDLADLMDTYIRFLVERGSDPDIGFRLRRLLDAAGLAVEQFRGWYSVIDLPPGLRPPAWAAREQMRDAGYISAGDITRWERAFAQLDSAEDRPQVFAAMFVGLGRRIG